MLTPLEKCRIWQETYINSIGKYIGQTLPGFPYKPGEYIPVTVRYSAMLEHQRACKVAKYNQNNFGEKP